ncbi:hypothetical protein ACH79_41255 [Bradyrhizobium sp. CCBAU 051011]|nr:hypothetical protein ACH79_41255 [Bradyrhizobium sp. CCBAU 051011]
MGLLIVLGLVFWALSAAYHFVLQNGAAIAGFAIVVGVILLIWSIGARALSSGKAPPPLPAQSDHGSVAAQMNRQAAKRALAVSSQEVVHPVLNEEAEVVEALANPRRTEWTPIRMRL